MIARILGPDDKIEYVALRLDERTRARDVWVPVRGDRGARGEVSELAAVKLCVREVQAQMGPPVEAAMRLHKLIREPEPLADAERRELARSFSESLEWLGGNVARLLDEPGAGDEVDIDAEYAVAEPADELVARLEADELGAGLEADELVAVLEAAELGADIEHLTLELRRVLKRDDPDPAKEIVLRCLDEYPVLVPVLAVFVEKFVAAGISPDEISAVIRMQRKDPSLLALLVGLLAILAAAHPTPQ